MRRGLVIAGALATLGGCTVFGDGVDVPTGFQGWFHVDRPGRATSLFFDNQNSVVIRDIGCDRELDGETPWVQDGDALVVPQWSGTPRFTVDSSTAGALVAAPGMYGTAAEQWLAGATCLRCPAGDAGVAVACDSPAVLDGGTPDAGP